MSEQRNGPDRTPISQATFDALLQARSAIESDAKVTRKGSAPAGLFLPYVGSKLLVEGGIYYCGQATRDDWHAEQEQTLPACLARSREFCSASGGLAGLSRTPFWSFLGSLTEALLGGPVLATAERWAWSNLLKIGATWGSPNQWPRALKDQQRSACVETLREELRPLRNTLVLIVSGDNFRITPEVLDDDGPAWTNEGGTYPLRWRHDAVTGNLLVRAYHPRALSHQTETELARRRVLELARECLALPR